jgi:hypothetical protein
VTLTNGTGLPLTTGVTGTLPIANGGTNATTAGAGFNALSPITTTGDLILGNGTNSATRLAIGANTYVLTSNGTTASWVAPSGGGTPGGSTTQVQYNNAGAFAGSANMTFNGTALTLANDASISGLTIGKGAGAISTNTAVGASALAANTTGVQHTVVGASAGASITTNSYLSAVGYQAAYYMTDSNDAFGRQALYGQSGATGYYNVAVGFRSGYSMTSGAFNTAIGNQALYSNTTANNNTAVGYQAGYSGTTNGNNVYLGYQAGYAANNGSGNTWNTFVGTQAGYNATIGFYNTFVGQGSGYNITTGGKNSILGAYTGNLGGLDIRTASNYIVLSDGDGNPRLYMDGSGYLYSAPTYVNTTGGSANLRMTGSNGQFALSTSSLRYKKNIQNAPYGLADVMAIRPVIYQSKSIIDGDKTFGGFIAEEIHDAGLTQFVDYDDEGRPNSLQYGNMVSLCVKAIQELNAKFDAYVASHP